MLETLNGMNCALANLKSDRRVKICDLNHLASFTQRHLNIKTRQSNSSKEKAERNGSDKLLNLATFHAKLGIRRDYYFVTTSPRFFTVD